MAKLIFTDEKFTGQIYELKQEKTTIGRGDQNHLIIPDASVSIQHCMILANGPEVLLCELDSSNGTYVDGSRISKQRQIKSGQTIRIGAATARLELGANDEFTDTEEMTAVLGYRRALQKGPSSPTSQPPPPTRLHSTAPADGEEPTVTLGRLPEAPRPSAPQPGTRTPSSQSQSSTPSSKSSFGLVLAAAGIILIILYWMIWGKK